MIYFDCLQQPAILEPEVEENCVASLFDNDDDVLIDSEPPQDSGDVDDNPDIDMLSADHYSVPPTTDSECDIAMPDNEESEPEAVQRTNRRQPSSKSNPSRQSVCGNLNVRYYDLNLYFLSDFGSTSESFSCRGLSILLGDHSSVTILFI